jgi:ribosomal protein S18 acetylase RimI-like enzyme|tara:strand:- start:2538 stop:3041 length:504 start_codon:yes stop_codon:yes gene_type:complete
MLKVQRYFLEAKETDYKKKKFVLPKNYQIILEKKNFTINKFFYKQIGIDHYWRDRLIWTDIEWKKYISNPNLETWIIKNDEELVGFYEQEYHPKKNEMELINMGILKEYRGKQLGSALLSFMIENSFKDKIERIWVHTCSLDHQHALQNYESKGFKIFKKEEIDFVA